MKIEEYPYEPKSVMINEHTAGLIVKEKSESNSTFTLQLFISGVESPIGFIWASSKRGYSKFSSPEKYIEVESFEMKESYRGRKIGKLLFNELVNCSKKCAEYAYINGYYADGNPRLAKYYKDELLCDINYNTFTFRLAL